jgi:hypothetical protein
MARRCEAIANSGKRCKNKAILGSTRCQVAAHNVMSAAGKGKSKTTTVPIAAYKQIVDSSAVSSVAEYEVRRGITPTAPTSIMPVEESTPDAVVHAHNDQTWTAFVSQPRNKFADKVTKPASTAATADDDEVSLGQSVHSNITATEVHAIEFESATDFLKEKLNEMIKIHDALMEILLKTKDELNEMIKIRDALMETLLKT